MTTPPKLQDVWFNRDLPVLVACAKMIDAGERHVREVQVAAEMQWPVDLVRQAIKSLARSQHLEIHDAAGGEIVWVDDLTPKAMVATGLYPDPEAQVNGLVTALLSAADQTQDPEEKSRLQKAADAIGAITQSVAGGVLTAWAQSFLPQ